MVICFGLFFTTSVFGTCTVRMPSMLSHRIASELTLSGSEKLRRNALRDAAGPLFRIGFLAETVVETQADHARLIGRQTQVEVPGVAVDDRVLVREVGDI